MALACDLVAKVRFRSDGPDVFFRPLLLLMALAFTGYSLAAFFVYGAGYDAADVASAALIGALGLGTVWFLASSRVETGGRQSRVVLVNVLRVIRIDIAAINTATGRNGLVVQTIDRNEYKSLAYGFSQLGLMLGKDSAARKMALYIRELSNQSHETGAVTGDPSVQLSFRWSLISWPVLWSGVVLATIGLAHLLR